MDQILSELAGRYRRNAIIAAFVLLLILLVPGVDFKDAGLFGVKVGGDARESEISVLCVLLLILVYHCALFLFYAHGDIQKEMDLWLTEMFVISAIFQRGVSFKEVKKRCTNAKFQPKKCLIHEVGFQDRPYMTMIVYGKAPPGQSLPTESKQMEADRLAEIRRRMRYFVYIDLPIPMLLAVWAVILTVCRLIELTPAVGDFFTGIQIQIISLVYNVLI